MWPTVTSIWRSTKAFLPRRTFEASRKGRDCGSSASNRSEAGETADFPQKEAASTPAWARLYGLGHGEAAAIAPAANRPDGRLPGTKASMSSR